MSTALALRQSFDLCRSESPVHSISTFMPRRDRLLFAWLHVVRRMLIQRGFEPVSAEAQMFGSNEKPGALTMWWRSVAREFVGPLPRRVTHPTDQPWPPTLVLAHDEEIMIVAIRVAQHVDAESTDYPWYCDGWRESVLWCHAGCPHDARDREAARVRVVNATADRFSALDTEGRLDAEPIKPALRIVQPNPPLDELPPVSMDLEAEICGEREDWEGF